MNDELHQPLGQNARDKRTVAGTPRRGGKLLWTGLAALALGAGAFALTTRDPLVASLGGRPYAIAKIEPYQPPPPEPQSQPQPQPAQTQAQPPTADAPQQQSNGRDHVITMDEFEQQSGVKVTRNGASGPGPVIIQVETESSGIRLPTAPDRRVSEKTRYGVLPRIGADGARPMYVYSRPFVTSARIKANAPKIALIVGGVGLNTQTTEAAISELPEAVTLAFAPYGATLEGSAARARARGHEVLLQTPMEPFDYPQNNPGPHTLLVDSSGDLEDLHWLMSRFTGYAGVMSFLGGRFSADEKALSPILADIGKRGLFFIDDGASPQSIIAKTAAQFSLPAARVDVVLDARGTPQSMDAALAQLETQARDSGSAIGFANAQTQSITRLARFAREVEKRGFVIAPVSATLTPAGHTAAATGAVR
jgi:polysaccharide deacetylase 2 family uncharacterized protein YibQ